MASNVFVAGLSGTVRQENGVDVEALIEVRTVNEESIRFGVLHVPIGDDPDVTGESVVELWCGSRRMRPRYISANHIDWHDPKPNNEG